MFKKFCSFVISTMIAAPAFASNWYISYNATDSHRIYFFEADTVARDGDTVTAWFAMYENPKDVKANGSYSTKSRYVADCKKRTLKFLSTTQYSENGDILKSNTSPGDSFEWIPDSYGEQIGKVTCAKSFPKPEENILAKATMPIGVLAAKYFMTVNAPKPPPD